MSGLASRQMPILRALENGACMTTDELGEAVGLDRRAVSSACCRLLVRGLIDRKEVGCFEITSEGTELLKCGEPITSGPVRPLTQSHPRTNRKEPVRDKIWRAMRITRKFSIADLQVISGAGYENARRYVLALQRAGYLYRLRTEKGFARTSSGFVRWSLVRDTGPAAPVWRPRRRQVFDRNDGVTHEVAA